MKNLTLLLLAIFVATQSLFAQSTTLTSEKRKVNRSDKLMNTDTSNFPYMAVTVMFRNQRLLQDKKFVGKFKKVEAFIAKAVVTYRSQTVDVPLFILQKDKGIFSTATYKEATIVKKLPVSPNSNDNPTATVIAEGTIKKQDIALLQKITKSIGSVVTNPTSVLGGPQAITTLFTFFDDAVTNLSSTTKITTSMKFNLLGLDSNKIESNGYSVVFLSPASEPIGDNFDLKLDSNNELTLYQNGQVFNKYPYFIVEVGVSKYLQIEGTPSDFFIKHANNCDITANDINQMRADLEKVKGSLSDKQLAAERNLMNIYSIHFAIANGVRAGANDPNIATVAYNSLFDYIKSKPGLEIFDESLRTDFYRNPHDILTKQCIDVNKENLPFYQDLSNLIPLLVKDRRTFTNEEVGILKSYLEKAKSYDQLKNLQFNLNVSVALADVEKGIFETKFAPLIRRITSKTSFDAELSQNKDELIRLRDEFINCSKCAEEVTKTQNYVITLQSDKETRQKITSMIHDSNETQGLANVALDNLESALRQVQNMGLTIVRQNLEGNINSLKINRARLDEKLSLISYLPNDITEIRAILSEAKNLIEATNANIKRVELFIKNNQQISSTPPN